MATLCCQNGDKGTNKKVSKSGISKIKTIFCGILLGFMYFCVWIILREVKDMDIQIKVKNENKFIRFLKDWTLILCLILGFIGFFLFKYVDVLTPLKHPAFVISHGIMPVLIFIMLLFTFSKVNLKQYCFKAWYIYIILIQLVMIVGLCYLVSRFAGWDGRFALEGAMICIFAPTATAAAVIVKKLGGNVPTITTYTLIAGFVTAATVPVMLPFLPTNDLHLDASFAFWNLFGILLSKVCPLLIAPFLLTLLLRWIAPAVNTFIAVKSKDAAFYIWGFALIINVAQMMYAIDHCHIDVYHIIMIALGGLVACLLQFGIGKIVGRLCHDNISCGQGMGQKNTIISIWISLTFMNPITAVGPGSYMIWQNIINSAQIIRKSKKDSNQEKK